MNLSCLIKAQENKIFWWGTTYSGFTNTHYGIKVGKMGSKIGLYGGCRFGKSYTEQDILGSEKVHYGSGIYKYPLIGQEKKDKLAYAVIFGMTNNLYTKDKHRFILQTGLGFGRWQNDIDKRDQDGGLELEIGLQYHYQHLIFQIALNHLDNYWSLKEIDSTIGIGLRF